MVVRQRGKMPARESADTCPGAAGVTMDPGPGGGEESSVLSRGGVKPLIHPHRHNLKNRFELHRTLGEGTYGKVKLAVEKSTGEQVAIKYVKKTKIRDDTDRNRIRREIHILSRLRHPHIVNIRQVFEKKDRIVLVMDCALGGELYDYLNTKRYLREDETRRIFRQIIAAVHYIHQHGIVHRDLKLENIILDGDGNIKIADFGLANYYNHNSTLSTFCGSPLYASPEIVNGKPYHGPEVDIWSLGVVLYTLAYGAMPFESGNLSVLRQQITSGQYAEPAQPCGAAGLIRHMMTVNPARRATAESILDHWWVNLGHEVTPDGRPYDPMPARPSHQQQGSFSSDSDFESESKPPAGLNHVPGARIGRKSVETSFDEDEHLYDIGTSAPTPSSVPSVNSQSLNGQSLNSLSANGQSLNGIPTDGSSVDGPSLRNENSCETREEKTAANRNWSQAIAHRIDEITARVIQSLAGDETLQGETQEEGRKTPNVFTFDKDSYSDSDKAEDPDKSSVFVSGEQTVSSDGEKPVVFDSDRKPRRGILKRKGKFSGGDSGCCIMPDDASPSPKPEEEESSNSKQVSGDSWKTPEQGTRGSRSSPVSPTLTFSKDLPPPSHTIQSQLPSYAPLNTSVPVNQCPVHRYPTSNTLPSSANQSLSSSTPSNVPYTSGQLQSPNFNSGQVSSSSENQQNVQSQQTNQNQTYPLPGALTNAQCTCTLDLDLTKVVRRRKGILKNGGGGGSSGSARNSLIEDARKRLSLGSLSSNSSADILDLSYDSGDGEQMISALPQYPAMSARNRGSLGLEAGDRNSFTLDGEFTAVSLEDPRQPLEYSFTLNTLPNDTKIYGNCNVSDTSRASPTAETRQPCDVINAPLISPRVERRQPVSYDVIDSPIVSPTEQCHSLAYSEFDEARVVCQQAFSVLNRL